MTPTTTFSAPRDLRARALWTLLALGPGAALHVWLLEPARSTIVLLAVAVAVTVESLVLRLRGRAVAAGLGDGGAVLSGLLLGLLLPADASPAMTAFAAVVAIGIGRQAFGGTGQYLFHPAMLGVVCATLLAPAPVADTVFYSRPELIVGAAYAAGGGLLMALRIVRWQAPLALLAALAVLALPGLLLTGEPAEIIVLPMFSAATLLVVFFVVGDPVCGCTSARGRVIYGAGIAAFAAALWHDGRLVAALPPAVLLMNLAAPALDRWLAPAPPTTTPAAPPR